MINWFNTSAPGSTMPEAPLPEELNNIEFGVDVTEEGTHVIAMYKQKEGLFNHVFFSKFYPLHKEDSEPFAWMSASGPYELAKGRIVDLSIKQEEPDDIALYTAPIQALEQLADEPVAWMDQSEYRASEAFKFSQTEDHTTPLYPRPQPAAQWVEVECPLCGEMAVAHTHPVLNKTATWVGFTEDDLYWASWQENKSFLDGVKWADAKLKEKNT